MKRSIIILMLITLLLCSCFLDPDTRGLPSAGLIAYYTFDGNVKDQYIFGNDCIDMTGSGYVEGINGLAKDFNGESDMLRLEQTLDVSQGLTFSFWLKSRGVKTSQENGVVIGKYDDSIRGRCFLVNTQKTWTVNKPSLRANFYAFGSSSTYRDCAYSDIMSKEETPPGIDTSLITLYEPMELPLNIWTYCVINVTETEIQAWINGTPTVTKLREYSHYCNTSEYFSNTDIPTYIGNCTSGAEGDNNHYNGAIDEMRIYKRPLTEEEIQYIFHNTNPGPVQSNSIKTQNS